MRGSRSYIPRGSHRYQRRFEPNCSLHPVSRGSRPSLDHARVVIADWRDDYNHVRPHKSLGDRTPASVEAGASNPPGRLLLNGASLNEQEDGEHVPVVTNPADHSEVQV